MGNGWSTKYNASKCLFTSLNLNYLKKEKNLLEEIKIYNPEGEIAKILASIQNNFPKIDIGSYPFMRPPKFGTNIVFKGTSELQIKKVIKHTLQIFEEKNILYEI